ncbi:chaperonin [Sporothrix epigloea]|uniref:Chaperonin n=1 Tax=Sporothrix epigloea TaxID=1892477 RepID=A0ABP0DCZ5_9PEZI
MAKLKGSPKGKAATKATAVKAATHKTMSSIKARLATFVAKGKERADAVKRARSPLPAGLRKRKNTLPHETRSDEEEDVGQEAVSSQDQTDSDDQSEETEFDPNDESQDEEEEEEGSSAEVEDQSEDSAGEDGEVQADSKYTIAYGFEDNGSHIPPDPRERSKNGRRAGRNLIIWNRPCMNEKLLLIYHYENVRHGLEVPMEAVAHRMNPGSSASAANQHFNRLRDEVLGKGHLVPPPLVRSKTFEIVDEHLVRGYIRVDKPGSQRIQVRAVSFDEHLPDNQHNRVGFNAHEKMGDNVWERADIVDKNGNVLMTAEERKHGKVSGTKVRMAVLQQAKSTKKDRTEYSSFDEKPNSQKSTVPDVAARARTTRKNKSASSTKTRTTTAPERPALESLVAPKSVSTIKYQSKKRSATRSAQASPTAETSSSDADYDPTGGAASKRGRSSRSKRRKTCHEPDHDLGLQEADSATAGITASFDPHMQSADATPALHPDSPVITDPFQPAASPGRVDEVSHTVPEPQHPSLLANCSTSACNVPMPEMASIDPGTDAISPPIATPGMATPIDSSQYAQSSTSPLSSPTSNLSSCEVEEYNPSIGLATNFQVQQASNALLHQGYLPMSAFLQNDLQPSPPAFVGRSDSGASPFSSTLLASSSNSDFFFGHNRGYSGSVPKADHEIANMPGVGGFVYPHQTFGMNMGPMIGQGISNGQSLVSGDLRNMHVYHNHGYTEGGL